MQKPIKFPNKKLDIMGTLHIPEGKQNFPGVVLLHGFTANKIEPHRLFWKISKQLEENGVASLRFDYRGCGESEGNSQDFTIKDYMADAKKAVKKLLKTKGLDKNNIALIGISTGGIVAAYVANQLSDIIKKVVLLSAVAKPAETFFSKPKKENPTFLDQYKNGMVDLKGNLYSKKFFDIAKRLKPVDKIKEFNGQILLIHSDKDESVSMEHMNEYANAKPNAQKVVINNADHTFNNSEKEKEVINKIVNFLK